MCLGWFGVWGGVGVCVLSIRIVLLWCFGVVGCLVI